jgi:hypothetical protein
MNKLMFFILLSPFVHFVAIGIYMTVFYMRGGDLEKMKNKNAAFFGIIILSAFWAFYFL